MPDYFNVKAECECGCDTFELVQKPKRIKFYRPYEDGGNFAKHYVEGHVYGNGESNEDKVTCTKCGKSFDEKTCKPVVVGSRKRARVSHPI